MKIGIWQYAGGDRVTFIRTRRWRYYINRVCEPFASQYDRRWYWGRMRVG